MRELAIIILDDEHGISMAAWEALRDALVEDGGHEGRNDDILDAVKITEGRVYLPEGLGRAALSDAVKNTEGRVHLPEGWDK